MKLQSQIKWSSIGTHRVMPPQATTRRLRNYMSQIGVTRISDSTGLDTLGMPVFSAIRPTDAGLFDGISVYNGKGLTKADSLAGAMMEAVERYCGEFWHGPRYQGTVGEIRKKHPQKFILDPQSMRLQQLKSYDRDIEFEWVDAWNLVRQRPALLPLNFVICPYNGPAAGVWCSSSHGLASGNTIEEAICHALAELIERDAYTLAVVRSQLAPKAAALVKAFAIGSNNTDTVPPNLGSFPLVNLESVPAPVRRLVARARRDGTKIWLRNITSDLGVPTFLASLQKDEFNGGHLSAGGFGCHPNATVAAIRAITEAAQGRIVQIQGVREDAKRTIGYEVTERVL